MKLISEILEIKGKDVLSVTPDTLVQEAVRVMEENKVGALLVMEKEKLVGLLSERDCAFKVILENHSATENDVSQFMSKNILCVQPQQTVEEGMALMTDKRIRHLPVIEGDRIAGIVSIGDLVKAIITDQQFVIEQLEHYVTS